MAYWIDSSCTACGECLPKCPNDAISRGLPIYRIEPLLCTGCVGYDDQPQCVDACPEGVIHLAADPCNLLAGSRPALGRSFLNSRRWTAARESG